MRFDGFALGWVVSDAGVFHEHDPSLGASDFEPVFVGYGFVGRYAVVLGEGDEAESGGSEQCGDLDSAQASVEEEVRQPVGM